MIILDITFKGCLTFHCADIHNYFNKSPIAGYLGFQLFTMINSPGMNNGLNYFLK